MKALNFETQHYKIKLDLAALTLVFVCKEILQEFEMEGHEERTYDIPKKKIDNVEYDSVIEYIFIRFVDGSYYQVKLESSCEIVIDHFDEKDELIKEIGCWNFYD